MKTLTLNITNTVDLLNEQRKFNCMVRYAYNRFKDELIEKDVRGLTRGIFKDQKSWFLQCAVKKGEEINNSAKDKKVIFGGKNNLKDYLNGKKTKEQYRLDKLVPIFIQGEASKNGNRSFEFHLDECYVIYKYSRNQHYKIEFGKPRRAWYRELKKIQQATVECKYAVSVGINVASSKLYVVFDEKLLMLKPYTHLKSNRVIGLDLNPNCIGLSVLEFNKNNSEDFVILHKECISTYELNRKCVKTEKRHYELIKVAQHIDKLVDYWKCSKLCIEDLKIETKNNNKKKKEISKKEFNRLTHNMWCKNLLVNKLKMLANVNGYEIVEVNPCYSSFIGNTLYGNEQTPDMVAASIEIGRRCYNKYKKGHFYPVLNIHFFEELWKQTLKGVKTWKDLYLKAKKLGRKYRFLLLDYIQNAVFSKTYRKLKVSYIHFG